VGNWLSIASGLVGLAVAIVQWRARNNQLKDTEAVLFAKLLQQQKAAVLDAEQVRSRVLSDPTFREWVRQQTELRPDPF